VRTKDDLNSRD